MRIFPPYPIAAIALIPLAIGLAGGAFIDHRIMQGRIDKITIAHTEELRVREFKRADDERAARTREQLLASQIGLIEQRKTDEIATINDRHSAAIASLQQRPDRKPAEGGVPSPTATCQAATGAELSRSDAGFLVGEAARADQLRTSLAACYQAYDSLR